MDGLARISVFRRLCAWRRDLHFGLFEAWLRARASRRAFILKSPPL
jgi:hypothetical protein